MFKGFFEGASVRECGRRHKAAGRQGAYSANGTWRPVLFYNEFGFGRQESGQAGAWLEETSAGIQVLSTDSQSLGARTF